MAKTHDYDDDQTEWLLRRRIPGVSIPDVPDRRHKTFCRWDDELSDQDAAWLRRAKRNGDERYKASEALRDANALRRAPATDELTLLESLIAAWQCASEAGVAGGRRPTDRYRIRVEKRAADIRTAMKSDTSIFVRERGAYAVDGIAYSARPIGAEARNRPQPWHPRLAGRRGPLVAIPTDRWDDAAFRATDSAMRDGCN
jgi:hypothetical protein